MSKAALYSALNASAPAHNPSIALTCSRSDGERLLLKHITDARAAVEMLRGIYGDARNNKASGFTLELLDLDLQSAHVRASNL